MFSATDIHARIKQSPFVPLRVVTSSGQAYDVYHPDLIMVGQRALLIGIPSAENPTFFDLASRVAILHVTDLQDLPLSTPTGSNGVS